MATLFFFITFFFFFTWLQAALWHACVLFFYYWANTVRALTWVFNWKPSVQNAGSIVLYCSFSSFGTLNVTHIVTQSFHICTNVWIKRKRDHKLLVNKHLFNFSFHQIWDMMAKFYFGTKKSFILFNTPKKMVGGGSKV